MKIIENEGESEKWRRITVEQILFYITTIVNNSSKHMWIIRPLE